MKQPILQSNHTQILKMYLRSDTQLNMFWTCTKLGNFQNLVFKSFSNLWEINCSITVHCIIWSPPLKGVNMNTYRPNVVYASTWNRYLLRLTSLAILVIGLICFCVSRDGKSLFLVYDKKNYWFSVCKPCFLNKSNVYPYCLT